MQLKLTKQVTLENPVLGDLALVNGSLYFFTDSVADATEEIAQHIQSTIQFLQGEWFLDQRLGFPLYQSVIGSDPAPLDFQRALFRRHILAVPGVADLISLTVSYVRATRTMRVDFKAQTDRGAIIDSTTFQPLIEG